MNEGYSVAYSSYALKDIGRIHGYIAFDLNEPGYALRTVKKIVDVTKSLCFMPERFSLVEGLSYMGEALHRAFAGNFLIFYVVIKTERRVIVARICHSGQDVKTLLEETI